MKRLPVPIVRTGIRAIDDFCAVIKTTIDGMSGQTPSSKHMVPLASTATTAQIVARLNELAARVQGDEQ